MSPRITPPFRADHVGSLLRPQYLLDARAEHTAGRLSEQRLRELEDDAISATVAMQERVGLTSATDGEFRRTSWHMDFLHQLNGVSPVTDSALTVRFHNTAGDIEFSAPEMRIDGEIGLDEPIFA